MKKFFLALFLLTAVSSGFADSRVFTLVNPNTDEVLQSLRTIYGDKIQADVVRGKLVVIGSKQQLDEIGALLVKLDPTPRALRLTLREQPPADDNASTVTYSTERNGYTIDTVEGAFVAIDYQNITQQPTTNGWWISIDNVPTQFTSLTLQIKIESGRKAIIRVSYAKQQDQERRLFGNTVVGDLGSWIPLLPRPTNSDDNTISSGPKPGEQLYLRVDKSFDAKRVR